MSLTFGNIVSLVLTYRVQCQLVVTGNHTHGADEVSLLEECLILLQGDLGTESTDEVCRAGTEFTCELIWSSFTTPEALHYYIVTSAHF